MLSQSINSSTGEKVAPQEAPGATAMSEEDGEIRLEPFACGPIHYRYEHDGNLLPVEVPVDTPQTEQESRRPILGALKTRAIGFLALIGNTLKGGAEQRVDHLPSLRISYRWDQEV